MTKKILLIIGILVIVAVVLVLIFGTKPQTPGESRVGFSIRNLLPFGGNEQNGSVSSTTETNIIENKTKQIVIDENKPVPRLRKISSEPVAGAIIFNTGTTSVVRFLEKGTGNVYEARSDSNNIQRLTNTTIPKIIRAFWLPNGDGFIAQTLITESETIETSFVKLNKSKASSTNESLTPYSTTINKLPTGIKEISVKPDGSKIFYYIASGISSWYTSNPDGTSSNLVLTHPLTEWLPRWISANTVIMQSKSSSETTDYYYTFDIGTKILKKVGVGLRGLSENTKGDGSLTLASNGGTSPQLFLVNNKNATVKTIAANTFAEKCVWLNKEKSVSAICAVPNYTPSGNYPDDWYKGIISTEDNLMKIDLTNSIYNNIADLYSISKEQIDAVDISISPDEKYLIFRNKIDGYLWMFRIAE